MTTERKTNDKGQKLNFGRWTPDAYFGKGGGFVAAYLDGAPVVDINAERNEDGTWKGWMQDNAGYGLEGFNAFGWHDAVGSRYQAIATCKSWIAMELGFGDYRSAWSRGRRARLEKKLAVLGVRRDEDAARLEFDAWIESLTAAN